MTARHGSVTFAATPPRHSQASQASESPQEIVPTSLLRKSTGLAHASTGITEVQNARRTTFKVVRLVQNLLKAQLMSDGEPVRMADMDLDAVEAATEKEQQHLRSEIGYVSDSDSEAEVLQKTSSMKSVRAKDENELRLEQALDTDPIHRCDSDVDAVCRVVSKMQDDFIQRLDPGVRRAICGRLVLEEYSPGDRIFEYGNRGDKLYIVLSGRICIEVPRPGAETDDRERIQFQPPINVDEGRAFGELALMSGDRKRHARASASGKVQLLALTSEDYDSCVGQAQERFLMERVEFLRSLDNSVLGDVPETDLRAMATHLRDDDFSGASVLLKQESDAEKVIFVRNGFCRVTRRLQPPGDESTRGEFWKQFDLHALQGSPPPNPYADDEDEKEGDAKSSRGRGARRDQSLGSARRLSPRRPSAAIDEAVEEVTEKLELKGRRELRQLLRRFNETEETRATRPIKAVRDGEDGDNKGQRAETVIVDYLDAGRSFGVMEMLEGWSYQCSVVADPWASVYIISKYDLIRNTSKMILHKLFLDYKARLTDNHLLCRLKQRGRWNDYKKDLLDEIRNRRARTRSVIDRREAAHRTGAGDLSREDYERVGKDEKIWDKRAQTPPKASKNWPSRTTAFTLEYVRNEHGRPIGINVSAEVVEASQVVLEEKVLTATQSARKRDRRRRVEALDGLRRTRSMERKAELSAKVVPHSLRSDKSPQSARVRSHQQASKLAMQRAKRAGHSAAGTSLPPLSAR